MPYSNNGGPWGGGGGGGDKGDGKGGRGPWDGGGNDNRGDNRGENRGGDNRGGNRGPGGVPDLDEIVRKGQEQLRERMGGRGSRGTGGPGGGGGQGGGRSFLWIGAGLAVVLWLFMSVYQVRPEEQSVELTFGKCRGECIGEPGLNFAAWPVVASPVAMMARSPRFTAAKKSALSLSPASTPSMNRRP